MPIERAAKRGPTKQFAYVLVLILVLCMGLHLAAIAGLLGDLSHVPAPQKRAVRGLSLRGLDSRPTSNW